MKLHQLATISVLAVLSILASVAFFGWSKASEPSLNNNPACLDLSKVKEPVIQFGNQNRLPYTITLTSNGEINTTASPAVFPTVPPMNLKTERLSPTTVKALLQLANGTNFWSLPDVIGQKNSRHDESWFIKINSPCASHSVVLYDRSKNDSNGQSFDQIYSLLSDLVKVDSLDYYKPVQ